ncbi:MAG: YtxH domain-containing protein [Candidatus Shapirobacteria bacterium]|jgi:gas vesicle protein
MAKNNFVMASLFGVVAGLVGGLLLAPKTGKQARSEVAKLAKDVSRAIKTGATETKKRVELADKYEDIKATVAAKVAKLKLAGEKIDKEKYGKTVDEVLTGFSKDIKSGRAGMIKMASYLKKDWLKIKKSLV